MSLKGQYKYLAVVIVILLAASSYMLLTRKPQREVVIYTSVDQVFSEPILDKFQADTGITVKAVYDVEAAKTTGLVNRLISEKNKPLADVWWSGEVAQTIQRSGRPPAVTQLPVQRQALPVPAPDRLAIACPTDHISQVLQSKRPF